jgi:hypothetical protein
MTHEKCKKKVMHEIMTEFQTRKLKQRDDTIVKDKKQALAIGLSKVEKSCEYSIKEFKELETKIKKYLSEPPTDVISLTRLIEIKHIIKHYYDKKDYKKCQKYEVLLWHNIITAISNGAKIKSNVWKELKIIKNMDFKRY